MAWVKIPKEHHPLFLAALPADRDVDVLTMFGGIAATVNGNMAGGLFARSMMVKLAPADLREALALEGASPFDPMGNGRIMHDTAMLPDDVMERPAEMRRWLDKAIAYTRTLPPKVKKGALPQDLKKTARIPAFSINEPAPKRTASVPLSSVRPAKKPSAKKPSAKKPSAKKPSAKKPVNKPSARKPSAKKPANKPRAKKPSARKAASKPKQGSR